MEFLYVSARLPRYTVGRDPGCDLVLSDPFISRVHLVFEPLSADVAALTVSGGNGATVRGSYTGKGFKCHVRCGDAIRVGRREFVWIGDVYKKTEFVRRPPRAQLNDTATVDIEAPPPRKVPEKPSVMLAAGPALTMAIPILLGAGRSIAVLSSLFAAVWAVANVLARARRGRSDERRRRNAYISYLKECEERIQKECGKLTEALLEYYPTVSSVFAKTGDVPALWRDDVGEDRTIGIRIGMGSIRNPLGISTPKERFVQVDDSLRELPQRIVKKYEFIGPAPVIIQFTKGLVYGVVLSEEKDRRSVAALLLKIAASVAPDKLNIVLTAKIDTMRYFMWCAILPHFCSDYAMADESSIAILTVTDNPRLAFERAGAGDFVILAAYDNDFPAGVDCIVNRIEKVKLDELTPQLSYSYAGRMSQLWGTSNNEPVPDAVPFGALFDGLFTGSTEDVVQNIIGNYKSNDITEKIEAPIGVGEAGEKLMLDLHERASGPHGLIAGTTGSGKSELLTTLILSLALTFPPDKAAFFLIDYKGGGMSNLFSDLPHLLGSISNLSKAESKRAEISLKSENMRRQRIFARSGVNNINDYTGLYDAGVAAEPLPHIFIIVDEFAELRKEEPDFMDRLISISQVGRSLGLHLILATQKPAGVVDDRIRANSRFRIALRLVDRADSMDMLRREDATFIKECGRAFLQVGNNEIFTCFQSGYAMCDVSEGRIKPHIYNDFWLREEIVEDDMA